jgi:outer membrane protein OmpA-like peptidoglycan-associated protein/opacity protein-like surface antigen
MRNRILKSAWMLALCLPTVALAQQRPDVPRGEGTWEFSGGLGLKIQDRALSGFLASGSATTRFTNTTDPGRFMPAAALRLGYNFNRHLGFSLGTELAAGSGVKYVTPFAAITWTKDLNAKTSPFITFGNQVTRVIGQNDRLDHPSIGFHLGLGLRHMISENVALRVEGRMALEHYQDLPVTKSSYPSMITIGLSYFTGGRRPERMAMTCPVCQLGRGRVDTVRVMRRDTLVRVRVDTVRMVRVDTVEGLSVDQLVLRVQFITDSTRLLRRTLPLLDSIARAIIATPDSRWEVQGHTDNVGTPEHNRVLGQGRAQSVVDYLVRRGVDRNILIAKGFGQDRPVVSNATVEGRAQNRRVQLRRIPAGPPPGRPVP